MELLPERQYGSLCDLLKEKGYDFVKPLDASTHGVFLMKNGDGKEFVLKANWDYRDESHNFGGGIQNEFSIGKKLEGIPGIAQIVEGQRVVVNHEGLMHMFDEHKTGKMPVSYSIKEYVPGKTLSTIDEITGKMESQMFETMRETHKRGVAYETEVNLNDFVLDETGRPVLVDFEFMKTITPKNKHLIGENEAQLANIIYQHRNSKHLKKMSEKQRRREELKSDVIGCMVGAGAIGLILTSPAIIICEAIATFVSAVKIAEGHAQWYHYPIAAGGVILNSALIYGYYKIKSDVMSGKYK